jgi:Flp pilus assembly protein TadB
LGNGDKQRSTNADSLLSVAEMSSEKIQSIVELQKLNTQSEIANIELQERQLDADLELAKLQIGRQAEIETARQRNTLKGIITLAVGLIAILTLVLGFIAWCLSLGKEQFVIELLKYSFYPISAGGGFWVGRISRQQKTLD